MPNNPIHPDFCTIVADLLTGTADAGTIFLAAYHFDRSHGYNFTLLCLVANATPESVNDLFPAALPLIIELLQQQFNAAAALRASFLHPLTHRVIPTWRRPL